eukprot:1140927-Pelagomonas_calceolata.AAC.4
MQDLQHSWECLEQGQLLGRHHSMLCRACNKGNCLAGITPCSAGLATKASRHVGVHVCEQLWRQGRQAPARCTVVYVRTCCPPSHGLIRTCCPPSPLPVCLPPK